METRVGGQLVDLGEEFVVVGNEVVASRFAVPPSVAEAVAAEKLAAAAPASETSSRRLVRRRDRQNAAGADSCACADAFESIIQARKGGDLSGSGPEGDRFCLSVRPGAYRHRERTRELRAGGVSPGRGSRRKPKRRKRRTTQREVRGGAGIQRDRTGRNACGSGRASDIVYGIKNILNSSGQTDLVHARGAIHERQCSAIHDQRVARSDGAAKKSVPAAPVSVVAA